MKYAVGIGGLAVAALLFVFVSEIAGIAVMVIAVVLLPWTPSPGFGAQADDDSDGA